ncbi:uncharacterized protein LOC131227413 [Magnolia sinica]|uniref:uncharacterized protein LOC131227413 n=1 Tax=Magnolia sinica TaxID=86752 RepID=UPI00265938CA|nr:uncharacterized protein LOC131227413 [Magnolia sinica]
MKRLEIPLDEGELGFRRLQDVIQAFRLKMAWSILFEKNESLWGTFMGAKYISVLHPDDSNRQCCFTSPLWTRIQSQFSLLAPIVQQQLGEGTCLLWSKNWSGLGRLMDVVVTPIPEVLLEMQLLTQLGKFTVSSVRNIYRSPSLPMEWSSHLWSSVLLPKILLLAWRIIRNAVPVDSALQSWGIQLASACVCCGLQNPIQKSVETIPHLFLHSCMAKALWGYVGGIFHIHILPAHSFSLRIEQWKSAFSASGKILVAQKLAPYLICWVVWNARNFVRFVSKSASFPALFAKID